jgi:ubiquinone/menaquinone biosynthesis C-methylase UbiE
MVEPATNLREGAERAFGDRAVYHEASAYDMPFGDASMDAALMVRVFHHLDDPERAMRELHRIVKPGGLLVFNFSNNRNIKRFGQFLLGKAGSPFSPDIVAYYPTLIGHHPRYINHLLSTVGFKIEKQYGVGITDKAVGVFPWFGRVFRPTLFFARLAGILGIAPANIVVARRT